MKTFLIMLGMFFSGMTTMTMLVRASFKSATKELNATLDSLPKI